VPWVRGRRRTSDWTGLRGVRRGGGDGEDGTGTRAHSSGLAVMLAVLVFYELFRFTGTCRYLFYLPTYLPTYLSTYLGLIRMEGSGSRKPGSGVEEADDVVCCRGN
jgi:hypothetical protein